jgi:hypothetical protein
MINKKFHLFVIALISAMLLAFTVSSSWAVWTVDVQVASDDGGLTPQNLTFGTDTSVPNVQTPWPPTPPSGNYLNAAFSVPPFAYYSTYTNANGPWLLRIKTNVGFTLAWDTADLAAIPAADGIYHISSALDGANNPRLDWELLRSQPASTHYSAGNYYIRITKISASERTASLVSGERIAFQADSLSTGAAIELVSGTGGNLTVTRNDTTPPDAQGLPYHWVITPVSDSQVKLRFYYNDADLDRDENKYRLAYKNGSEWNIVTDAVQDLNKNYFETPQIDHTSTWCITFAEVVPPEIVDYYPPDGSIINVAPLIVTIQFSEEMDKKSVLESRFTRTNVTDSIVEIEADLCTFLWWFGYTDTTHTDKYNSYGCEGPYGIVKAGQFDLSFNEAGDTLTINTEVEIDAPGTPIMLPNKEYRLSIVLNKAMDLAGNLLTLVHLDYTYYTEIQSVTDLTIEINGDSLDLSWSPITSMTYDVYRDTTAYFEPDTVNKTNRIASGISGSQPTITFTDNNIGGADVVGDVENNYFYVVIAVDGGGNMSGISNRVGEYDVDLKSTPTTDWNLIAGPVGSEDITKASELMAAIPNANAVAYWDAALQGYVQYVPVVRDFSVTRGYPYYVNVTADAIWTIAGALTTPTFSLITTESTDWNTITVPLDKVDITKASELLADIPSCNAVAYWDAALQGYVQYVPVVRDFSVRAGRAYYVNVTADVIWPESTQASPAKELLSKRGQLSDQIFGTPPHIVYGVVETSKGAVPKASELTITAFIKDRPSDILIYDIPQNPGAPVKIDYQEENGIWLVQIAGFEGKWSQGEMLRIDFHDKSSGQSVSHEMVLSDEPIQNLSGKVLRLSAPVPKQSALLQNYPNPFNPETWIPYKLSYNSDVTITIYNIQGQLVRSLNLGHREAGFYVSKESAAYWNGKNDSGEQVASGVYFYQIKAGDFNAAKRLVILK